MKRTGNTLEGTKRDLPGLIYSSESGKNGLQNSRQIRAQNTRLIIGQNISLNSRQNCGYVAAVYPKKMKVKMMMNHDAAFGFAALSGWQALLSLHNLIAPLLGAVRVQVATRYKTLSTPVKACDTDLLARARRKAL